MNLHDSEEDWTFPIYWKGRTGILAAVIPDNFFDDCARFGCFLSSNELRTSPDGSITVSASKDLARRSN
jgi:hypothetical protein